MSSEEANLTPEEVAAAAAFGMSAEEYAHYKSRTPILPPAESEQERLKAALREVLDQRERRQA
jgi:hypothetical protein